MVKKKVSEQLETFGQWLKREREGRGLSQEELGKRISRSKQHISNLERAAPHPKTGKLSKVTPEGCNALAGALHIPPEVAFRAAGFLPPPPNGDDPRRLRLVACFDGLSDGEKDSAVALMESMYKHRLKAAHS